MTPEQEIDLLKKTNMEYYKALGEKDNKIRALKRKVKAEHDSILKVYGDVSECHVLKNVLRWIDEA